MKIIKEKYAYIQLEDINYLMSKETVPLEIARSFCVTDEITKYHFVKISDEKAIKFIESAGCILSYDDLIKKSNKELAMERKSVEEDINKLRNTFDSLTKSKDITKFNEDINDLMYKRSQMTTFMEYRKGLISDIVFPADVKPPKKNNKVIAKILSIFNKDRL